MFYDNKESTGDSVTFSPTFLCKKVYNKTKAKDGLDKKKLTKLLDLLTYAQLSMDDARIGHIKLEMPTAKLKDIGRFLKEYSKKYQLHRSTSNILYALKYEQGIKNKREHAHLYVIADGWETRDFLALERDMEIKGFSGFMRSDRDRPVKLLRRAGEFVPDNSSKNYHRLNSEFDDAFARISYLAKIKTTSTLRRKPFSTSAIPFSLSLVHSFE